jgi:integrase/recombinase XerD
MDRKDIDWNEPPLKRWMGTTVRKGTQHFYRSAYRAYTDFTGMTATQLIDEAVEDMQRDVRERQDVLKTRLRNFYEWLTKEFPVHSRGNSRGTKEHEVIRKGLREKSANAFVMAVRSFYATYDITVKLKGRERLPRPKVYNRRMQLSTLNVKALVDHARSPRDRAIILSIFQGGMDVSTLCGMKYSDAADGLVKDDFPLKLELQRPKTGVDYYTFLGRDAINAIKAYLNDARSRGMQFKADTPLFVQEVKGKRGEPLPIDTYVVQKVMREVAVRSGLVDSENNGKDMNPVSPHALRESFGSIMTNAGVPDTIVDFWLGHEIGTMAEAYKGGRYNELKTMYTQKEPLISITASESQTIEEVRTALGGEIADLAVKVKKLEEQLRWAIDEIENLETEGKGYEKEG